MRTEKEINERTAELERALEEETVGNLSTIECILSEIDALKWALETCEHLKFADTLQGPVCLTCGNHTAHRSRKNRDKK